MFLKKERFVNDTNSSEDWPVSPRPETPEKKVKHQGWVMGISTLRQAFLKLHENADLSVNLTTVRVSRTTHYI